jgi:hypothetical protein
MAVLKPVLEPTPNMPVARKGREPDPNYGKHQLFGFDTETTRCGRKELRSSQFAYYNGDKIDIEIVVLKGWFDFESTVTAVRKLKKMCDVNKFTLHEYDTVEEVRKHTQETYESLTYGEVDRLRKTRTGRIRRTKREVQMCGALFNANFDLGVIADSTDLIDDMVVGGMEGSGVTYHFNSADRKKGMRIECLYLGAFHVPFPSKRGQVWDIAAVTRTLWGAANLQSVGRHLGYEKLVDEGERSLAYAAMDAVITLEAAWTLTTDLESMGFQGNPDRFISNATIAKDLLRQHYTPFYLDEEQHNFVWPAYFGGMTGALDIFKMREPLENMVYGDLDGAYNASGQMLNIFKWRSVEWVNSDVVRGILNIIENDPKSYWEYGSLHIEVEGDFDNVPLRVGKCGADSTPSKSEGLVWARVTNYRTTMSLGDYLHSRPHENVKILRGLLVTEDKAANPDLFKMCDDERRQYPKWTDDGVKISENIVPNMWWKTASNAMYGCFANRNGKERLEPGKWFNALIASSITGAIRHCMWTVNESSGAVYNDTDSALTSVEGFEKARAACAELGIGFSNKTNDELEGHDKAALAVVQGSKRYALLAEDGTFGAKCHGLGSWHVYLNGKRQSVAHNEDILLAVWQFNYPEVFGNPCVDLIGLPVFHTFGVRTKVVANRVKEYARRQLNVPLQDLAAYGKAGNFGFLSPTLVLGKVIVVASYEPDEAARLSDLTLADVAYAWGRAYDKKFDYENLERWTFDGGDIVEVAACDRSQDLNESVLTKTDISVHVNHDMTGE